MPPSETLATCRHRSDVNERFAELVVAVVGAYVAAGAVFAAAFVTWGVSRLDPVAREGTWGFRLIILPGVTALWPRLALRWVSGAMHAPDELCHLADLALVALRLRRPVEAVPADDAEGLQIAADGGLRHLEAHPAQGTPDVELPLHRLLGQDLEDRPAAVVLMLAVDAH